MAHEKIDFSGIIVTEVSVEIGKDKFILREANGDVAVKFRNARLACYVYTDQGILKGIEGMANLEPMLVAGCLFKVTPSGERPVTEDEVRALPARVQKKLFARAKAISDLTETALTERQALSLALEMDASPVKLGTLQAYVETLEGEDWETLKNWIAPTAEESAKNLQSGMSAGSA